MRGTLLRQVAGFFFAVLLFVIPAHAQEDSFRWIDFHSAKDQPVITWVNQSLAAEKWTAIREIGVIYDAALVVTTLRPSPQAPPSADTFTVWSISLTNHSLTILLKGVNLRLLDWMKFSSGGAQEVGALYDNCADCPADTYLTAFRYDFSQHIWLPRWLRGEGTIPIWTAKEPEAVTLTQVYAVMAEESGREYIATWNHFDYGKLKPVEDFVYQYDLDPHSGLERTQLLTSKDAEAMKQRLCRGQDAVPALERGQDSQLCSQYAKPRSDRRVVTTPPANNHGQSTPPRSAHRP